MAKFKNILVLKYFIQIGIRTPNPEASWQEYCFFWFVCPDCEYILRKKSIKRRNVYNTHSEARIRVFTAFKTVGWGCGENCMGEVHQIEKFKHSKKRKKKTERNEENSRKAIA
jgi:allophanate hydrolase subunit 1